VTGNKDGKQYGMHRRFHKNGRMMLEEEVKSGWSVEKVVGWHDNGQKYFEKLTSKDVSKVTFWDLDGNESSGEDMMFRVNCPYKRVGNGPRGSLGMCSYSSGKTIEEAVVVLACNGPVGRKTQDHWIVTKYPSSEIIQEKSIETFDIFYTWYSIKLPGVDIPLTVYFNSTNHYGIF
jgi:hypothetical protein